MFTLRAWGAALLDSTLLAACSHCCQEKGRVLR